VVVYADGTRLIGVATATAQGAWSMATQGEQLASGGHEITASACSRAQVWSTVTKRSMVVDPAPTASLAYDNGLATLTFSEPVSGVRASNLLIAGRMTERGINIPWTPVTDRRGRQIVGEITMSPTAGNATTFTFQVQRTIADPGSYTLKFVRTGVKDQAGNPLAADASTTFTII